MVELALLHLGSAAPTLAIDHLFVGQNGHVDRIPIDLALLAIDQARFIHINEKCLLVTVIFGVTGGELARPVERKADPFQLRFHVGNVFARPSTGMYALFHRGIFCRHTESVPAHWMQHFVPAHLLVARQHITHGVVAHMAHVDAP